MTFKNGTIKRSLGTKVGSDAVKSHRVQEWIIDTKASRFRKSVKKVRVERSFVYKGHEVQRS